MNTCYILQVTPSKFNFDRFIFSESLAKEICDVFNLDLGNDFTKCVYVSNYAEFSEYMKNSNYQYSLKTKATR